MYSFVHVVFPEMYQRISIHFQIQTRQRVLLALTITTHECTLLMQLAGLGASCMIVDASHTTVVGTPFFMAPEVLSGKPQDVQADVYSLGCVLYMLCMLKPPFRGANFAEISCNVQQSSYEEIPKDNFSSELIDMIERMLSRDATKRPTANAICELDWLFDLCKNDFAVLQHEYIAFHQELESRLTPGYTKLDSSILRVLAEQSSSGSANNAEVSDIILASGASLLQEI